MERSLLICAARYNHERIILNEGADVDLCLYSPPERNSAESHGLLLDWGVDPNTSNDITGDTPLHSVVRLNHEAIFARLVDGGADIEVSSSISIEHHCTTRSQRICQASSRLWRSQHWSDEIPLNRAVVGG